MKKRLIPLGLAFLVGALLALKGFEETGELPWQRGTAGAPEARQGERVAGRNAAAGHSEGGGVAGEPASGLAERQGTGTEVGGLEALEAEAGALGAGREALGTWPDSNLLVRLESGEVLAGAHVSAHVWNDELAGFFFDGISNRALWAWRGRSEVLWEQRREVLSGPDGLADLAPHRELLEGQGEVLWVTHPRGKAKAWTWRFAGQGWPREMVLEARAPAWARITEAGQPVQGATLFNQALLPRGWSPFDDFERIRRPLQRRSESAKDGRAALEDLSPRQVVWAELGALRSLPVELEEARDVELELLPQLSAGGALIPRDGAHLDAWAVVSVEAVPQGEDPAEGQWLATERVGGRSSWGPMLLPRLPEGLEYRIALRMGGNSSAEVRLPAPAGAELVADLAFGPGTQLLVAVKDRSNNQAVSGARLRAWPLVAGASQVGGASLTSKPGGQSADTGAASPGTSSGLEASAVQPSGSGGNQSPDSPSQADPSRDNSVAGGVQSPNSGVTHAAALQGAASSSTSLSGITSGKRANIATGPPDALVRTTDHFGAACLIGLERHVPFALEVAAPGFVTQRFEGLVGHAFDLTNAQRLDVWLEPVAALEGQVYVDGQPARDFELYWTSQARVEWRRIPVTAAENGRFRLEEAPSGGVALYASVSGRGFSPMVQSKVPAAEPLRLDITAGWTGSGLVRDGLSGAPIAGARLEWLIGDLDFPVARQLAPMLSAADGGFEVAGLHPDCLRLVVSAPGYRATRVFGIPDGAGQVDFGIAEMLASGSLEVQVEGAAEPQTLSIRLGWGNAGQGQPFDAQGRAFLALERSSDYLTLRHRDGLEDIYYIEPEAQASGQVVLAVATEQNLDLVALGESEVLSGGVDTLLKWIDRRGNSVRRSVQLVQPSASARIPGIAAERVDVEWAFGQPRQSSMASFALSDKALQQLDLPVGGESWQFLMVDQSGQPVTGVQGVIYHRQGESVTRGFDFAPSDSQGLIQATRAQSGSAWVSFLGGGGAVLPDVPIQEQDFQAGPLKILFDPGLSLDLFLTSAGAPLSGARVRAETASGNVLLGSQFSDGLGRLTRQRLGAGRYWLFVEHRDHWPLRLTVDLNGSMQSSLELPKRASLNLVLRANGSALANSAVLLTYLDLPEDVSLLSWPLTGLRTDGQGQLTGISAPTGRLRIACAEGSAEFDHAAAGEPIEVNLD